MLTLKNFRSRLFRQTDRDDFRVEMIRYILCDFLNKKQLLVRSLDLK